MALSATKCVVCGRPLELFSGLAVNGDAYHDQCWTGGTPVPRARPETRADQQRPSEGSHTAS